MKMALVKSNLGDSPAANLMFNERIRQMIKDGQFVYHFGFGQAPFPVIESALDSLKENAGQNAYLPVQGIPELRQGICNFHARYDSLGSLDPNNVIVGPGSKELIYLLLNVFNGTVLLLAPSWPTYEPQAVLAGRKPVIISTSSDNNWQLTPELLEQAIESNHVTGNKLLILTNPDNPTGTSYGDAQLVALSKAFRKNNVIVLSDEIYARLHYTQSHVTLAKHYPEGTVISSGLSKWASAGGWRIGYHIYPSELSSLLAAVKSEASHTYSCAPAPMQFAASKMFGDLASCDEYIRHTSRIMAAVSSFCCRELRSVGVKMVTPTAGYYVFPDFEVIRPALTLRGITTCQEMCDALLKEASVALMASGPAYLRPLKELTTRLCYVNFDGTDALANSRKLGLDAPLPEETFVKDFCTSVYDGILALKNWVSQLKHVQES
ncbi:aspartate aminotransferase-like isoform X2 [Haliotis rufescens]|uniref:aspartate aminotransferase-like isoform X2 n=1 Tax=Haliotis rufescens TaxID=6454 RepID=UPI00201F8CCB|nr:aspartate aminotransferase-like isoform X2 [Haliotis rufescens]